MSERAVRVPFGIHHHAHEACGAGDVRLVEIVCHHARHRMDDPVDQVLGQRIIVALVDSDEAALVVLDNVLVEEAVLGPDGGGAQCGVIADGIESRDVECGRKSVHGKPPVKIIEEASEKMAELGPGQERAARGPPRSGGGGADFFAFFMRKNWGNRPS